MPNISISILKYPLLLLLFVALLLCGNTRRPLPRKHLQQRRLRLRPLPCLHHTHLRLQNGGDWDNSSDTIYIARIPLLA